MKTIEPTPAGVETALARARDTLEKEWQSVIELWEESDDELRQLIEYTASAQRRIEKMNAILRRHNLVEICHKAER